jgi:cation diffusion facilitator CzcD-associated flavoprotein CzcO
VSTGPTETRPVRTGLVRDVDTVVIGAGQAGLSSAHHLLRLGLAPFDQVVVLDADAAPGGAWQHRWDSLTMRDVHRIAALPGLDAPTGDGRANEVVPAYFDEYERRFELPVVRPVRVRTVVDLPDGRLEVRTAAGTWRTRTLVNATGTWTRPFVPHYPGAETFAGRQLHTATYAGAAELAGGHVVVIGGGASAVQLLAEVSEVAGTTWVTRRPPVWRDSGFDADAGRAAVARVDAAVRAGRPPGSVVSVTGLMLREQEAAAAARGVFERLPMFARIEPDGVRWADARFQHADALLWATGFRAALDHLAPLHLREPGGGIAMDGTQVVRDPRVQLVGYGPSASTIGANRAGRTAAVNASRVLRAAA